LRSSKEECEVYQRNILTVNITTRFYYGNLCFIPDKENAMEIERLLLHQTSQTLYRYFEKVTHVFEFSFKENPFVCILSP